MEKCYTCNVCGAQSIWRDKHRHLLRVFRDGYQIWEDHFITCSDECRANVFPAFIQWMIKNGKSVEYATKNYNQTFNEL